MTRPRRRMLTDAEKDALLDRQAALIDTLMARITALEAALAKPRKTSRNSHIPSSQNPGGSGSGGKDKVKKKPRPSRPGVSRRLAATPDETIVRSADRCACGADVSELKQTCRRRYDHVDIPPVLPTVTRVELHGGRCACGKRFRASPPVGLPPGTPFGPNIHALLAYLHHSHHVGFERLARLARELFGLTISEGAVANALRRLETPLEAERAAIRETLRAAEVVWSDETTTRINGRLHWHWVFVTPEAVLHEIAPRRAKARGRGGDGRSQARRLDFRPLRRPAGDGRSTSGLPRPCAARCYNTRSTAVTASSRRSWPSCWPWTIAIGRRRGELKDSTLRQYRIKADCRLDRLLATPARHSAGRTLQAQVKAWRTKFFVFLEDRRVSATNNIAERGDPALGSVSQGHRRIPIRVGPRRPRRLPIRHQHCPHRRPNCLRRHP